MASPMCTTASPRSSRISSRTRRKSAPAPVSPMKAIFRSGDGGNTPATGWGMGPATGGGPPSKCRFPHRDSLRALMLIAAEREIYQHRVLPSPGNERGDEIRDRGAEPAGRRLRNHGTGGGSRRHGGHQRPGAGLGFAHRGEPAPTRDRRLFG